MRTLGRRIIHLDPARGFAAETVAAGVLYTTAFAFEAPISTTHTITSAVMGVGATKRLSAVRWGVARHDRRRLGPHVPVAPGLVAAVTLLALPLRLPAALTPVEPEYVAGIGQRGRSAEATGDVVLGALVPG